MKTSRVNSREPLKPLPNGAATVHALTKRAHHPSAIPETMAFVSTAPAADVELSALIRDGLSALPKTATIHEPRRLNGGARPSEGPPMRLRTPSPDRLRRRLRELDQLDAAKRTGMPAVIKHTTHN